MSYPKKNKKMVSLNHNEDELFRVRLSRGFYKWNIQDVMNTVTQHPEVLTKCGKTLALQKACDMDRNIVSIELIRLLIEEGCRQNFGERGGLRTSSHKYGSAPLQVLVKRGSLRVLKFLSEANPPLLCKEDVSSFNLLHFAAGHGHVDVVRFLMQLDPDSIYSRDQDGALPIHVTCNFQKDCSDSYYLIRELLLDEYIQKNHLEKCYYNNNNNSSNNNINDEVDHDEHAITILEWFFPRVHASKDAIDKYVKDIANIMNHHSVSIPLLCAAVRVGAPYPHLKCIIDLVHNAASVRDHDHRLPIHLAVERGMLWSKGLRDIVRTNPEGVNERDCKTFLFPFALAASGEKSCELDSIYMLMQHHPELVDIEQ